LCGQNGRHGWDYCSGWRVLCGVKKSPTHLQQPFERRRVDRLH
jgi:hypothetical protein